MTMTFDIIIFDNVGVTFAGDTLRWGGLGGSEMQQIVLAEALTKAGMKVACMNRMPSWCKVRGVDYLPIDMMAFEKFSCGTLIVERSTPVPHTKHIEYKKVLRWITDAHGDYPTSEHIVCLSEFQAGLLSEDHERSVINFIVPNALYDRKRNRNTKEHSFIYASAAMKGLRQTLEFFSSMKQTKEYKNATLKVLNPGYDLPKEVKYEGVEFLGALPFREVMDEYQTCRSMLMVMPFRETFGLAQVFAEALGLNVFVFQALGKDALSELCNSPLITDDPKRFQNSMNAFGLDPSRFKPVPHKMFLESDIVPQWQKLFA